MILCGRPSDKAWKIFIFLTGKQLRLAMCYRYKHVSIALSLFKFDTVLNFLVTGVFIK
jgi:hypothetical protein